MFAKLNKTLWARRVKKTTARAWMLVEDKPYDIVLLFKRRFLRVDGVGCDIKRVDIEVENLLDRHLVISIKPGVYFQSKGNYQNMAATKFYECELEPTEKRTISIDATCINADLPIPGEKDRFVGVKHVDSDVARFLERTQGLDYEVIQAGVWAITDEMSGYAISERLKGTDSRGKQEEIIKAYHIREAKEILRNLKIRNVL